MFSLRDQKNARLVAHGIAREIGRRGSPAKTKTITMTSAAGRVREPGIAIPGRGIAVISDSLDILVVSYNNPLPVATTFEYKSVEAAAENILRNLPLL